MSINKKLLFEAIKKDIEKHLPRHSRKIPETGLIIPPPDKKLILYLTEKIIFDDPTDNCRFKTPRSWWDGLPKSKSLFHNPPDTGLPIGNLTSQLFSNIYLNRLDNYVKRDLHVKHYGRYVDDFFLIHNDKQFLQKCVKDIDEFLKTELQLNIHPKKIYLQKVTRGVNFLGAYVKPHRRYTANRTTGKIKLAFQEISDAINDDNGKLMQSKINSYLGYMKNFNEYKLVSDLTRRHRRLLTYGSFNRTFRKFIPKRMPLAERLEDMQLINADMEYALEVRRREPLLYARKRAKRNAAKTNKTTDNDA